MIMAAAAGALAVELNHQLESQPSSMADYLIRARESKDEQRRKEQKDQGTKEPGTVPASRTVSTTHDEDVGGGSFVRGAAAIEGRPGSDH